MLRHTGVNLDDLGCEKISWIWHQNQQKKEIEKLDFVTIKKDNLQNGRIYLQIISLIGNQCPAYINNSYKSMTKRQQNSKLGKKTEQIFLQRKYTGGQQALEKMLNIISLSGNAN